MLVRRAADLIHKNYFNSKKRNFYTTVNYSCCGAWGDYRILDTKDHLKSARHTWKDPQVEKCRHFSSKT